MKFLLILTRLKAKNNTLNRRNVTITVTNNDGFVFYAYFLIYLK